MAEKKHWLQSARKSMEKHHTVGLFTRKAKAAGESVREYAMDKYTAPGKLGKEARFAAALEKKR